MTGIDKAAILIALKAHLQAELTASSASQRVTHAGATHEEAKPENSKDTRALEQSYLARGLAARVAELQIAVAQLGGLQLRDFDDDTPIALTALVSLEDEDGAIRRYFISPAGGGASLEVASVAIRVITPEAPLARALFGRRVDDEIEHRAGGRVHILTIVNTA